MIKFQIPGTEGVVTDLTEIPLLISIFHLTNPIYIAIEVFFPIFNNPEGGSMLSTFFSHLVAVGISWFLLSWIKKRQHNVLFQALSCFVFVFFYYTVLLLPMLVVVSFLDGLNRELSFMEFYKDMIYGTRYEMITTSLSVSLYSSQYSLRQKLKAHLEELEDLVDQRTEHLNQTITELKTTQNQLVQSEKMASLGTLTAGVAHELNNPLNYLTGGYTILKEWQDHVKETASQECIKDYNTALNMMKEGLERSVKIVKVLSNFSDKNNDTLSEMDVHLIVENTLMFLNYKFPENITVQRDFKLTQRLLVHPGKLHQAILNILHNAIYAIEDSGAQEGKIVIATWEGGDMAFLSIFNSGPPIPDDKIWTIFDPFYTTKEPDHGIGLGLSVAYAIAQEHGGEITAENLESGVRFLIKLPLKRMLY